MKSVGYGKFVKKPPINTIILHVFNESKVLGICGYLLVRRRRHSKTNLSSIQARCNRSRDAIGTQSSISYTFNSIPVLNRRRKTKFDAAKTGAVFLMQCNYSDLLIETVYGKPILRQYSVIIVTMYYMWLLI